MEYHTSPRIGKIKALSNNQLLIIDKPGPINTPPPIRQARTISVAESKKQKRSKIYAKPSKPNRIKTDNSVFSFVKQQNSSISRNMVVNFVNESNYQEFKILKSENTELKNLINEYINKATVQKEEYEKRVLELENEKDLYKEQCLKLLRCLCKNGELSSKFKKELEGVIDFDDVFDEEKNENNDVLTARFRSLNELQMQDVLNPVIEVIALEGFNCGQEGFLKVSPGDRIEVLEKISCDWWLGRLNSEIGKFPVNSILND